MAAEHIFFKKVACGNILCLTTITFEDTIPFVRLCTRCVGVYGHQRFWRYSEHIICIQCQKRSRPHISPSPRQSHVKSCESGSRISKCDRLRHLTQFSRHLNFLTCAFMVFLTRMTSLPRVVHVCTEQTCLRKYDQDSEQRY